jgi:hypothetical protein
MMKVSLGQATTGAPQADKTQDVKVGRNSLELIPKFRGKIIIKNETADSFRDDPGLNSISHGDGVTVGQIVAGPFVDWSSRRYWSP